MTGAPRGGWRWELGPAVLLAVAFLAAAALPEPHSVRERLWAGALLLVVILAGLTMIRAERRKRALEDAYRATLDIISRLIDSVDRFSEHHSRRVAESSVEVARALGCSGPAVEDIRAAALLHDLGKLDLPAEALAGATRLPSGEPDRIGRHAGPGGGQPDARGSLHRILLMVACCQERWDGTGKRAIRGAQIPLGARILAVADAYDAIVTDRAQRKARSPAEAIEALEEASGTQFDPQVVETFVRLRGAAAGAAQIDVRPDDSVAEAA